jgi:hypothetical protein
LAHSIVQISDERSGGVWRVIPAAVGEERIEVTIVIEVRKQHIMRVAALVRICARLRRAEICRCIAEKRRCRDPTWGRGHGEQGKESKMLDPHGPQDTSANGNVSTDFYFSTGMDKWTSPNTVALRA